jgi:hypothetical protein
MRNSFFISLYNLVYIYSVLHSANFKDIVLIP